MQWWILETDRSPVCDISETPNNDEENGGSDGK